MTTEAKPGWDIRLVSVFIEYYRLGSGCLGQFRPDYARPGFRWLGYSRFVVVCLA
jgi:hypothetical protein